MREHNCFSQDFSRTINKIFCRSARGRGGKTFHAALLRDRSHAISLLHP